MEIVTRKDGGLFPAPKQISFECSCPDWAGMCKHVAATLYGVGVRLDDKPELLFDLRGVDHADLVGGAAAVVPRLTKRAKGGKVHKVIEGADLSALFGIELESSKAKVATTSRDGAGDRSHTRAEVPRPRRAKSAKGTDSVTELNKVVAKARGTRRGTNRK